MSISLLRLLTVSLLCLSGLVFAAPYVPDADARVLERLPFKSSDPVARSLAQDRARLQREPNNVTFAVSLAQRYYELVAGEGDPRYLGYAQAALAPWWNMREPPLEVQVMRASLAQFRHDFAGAVADLTRVLEREPGHARARALRATIHIVQARYSEARSDCRALHGATSVLIALGCEAMVDGLTGKAEAAYQILAGALQRLPEVAPADKLWVLLRLAEISQRLGQAELAEMHFKQALALRIPDTFLLAAYADYLLDQKRFAEVVAITRDKQSSDSLLLRLVLAEHALKLPQASQSSHTLEARFAAARMRGDNVHEQEEARFALDIKNNPKQALDFARQNWQVQREPRDARVFLEAAIAANDAQAAQPVLQWLQASRIEDAYLARLARQLQGAAQ